MTPPPEKPNGASGTKIVRRILADGSIREYRYEKRAKRPRKPTGGLRVIFNAYSASPEFKRLCKEWRDRKLWLFNLIEHRLGWMTLAELEERNARRKFYELRDEYADLPHRADKMMQALSSALSWAYDRGMIGYNHASRIGQLAEPRETVTFYDDEAHARLVAELPEEMRHLYLLGLYTGARRADLAGLTWAQIDGEGWLTFTPSKTRAKTRATVALPTRVLKPLAGLLREIPTKGPTILTQLNGEPWNLFNLSIRWRRQMVKFDMVGMRFQDVRHTTATQLVEAGCTEAERGAVLGHAISTGAGKAYVARTRTLTENAYRKWNDVLTGETVIPLRNREKKTGDRTA